MLRGCVGFVASERVSELALSTSADSHRALDWVYHDTPENRLVIILWVCGRVKNYVRSIGKYKYIYF